MEREVLMNSVMYESRLHSSLHDLFGIYAPVTYRPGMSPRSTNGEMKGQRFSSEWVAQRKWEDDGGRVGQD
jgi:hypothetical protein